MTAVCRPVLSSVQSRLSPSCSVYAAGIFHRSEGLQRDAVEWQKNYDYFLGGVCVLQILLLARTTGLSCSVFF